MAAGVRDDGSTRRASRACRPTGAWRAPAAWARGGIWTGSARALPAGARAWRGSPHPLWTFFDLCTEEPRRHQGRAGRAGQEAGEGASFGRAKRLIGNGLVMAEGQDHQRQRRLMQPAFHRAEIAGYLGTMREVAVPRISAWRDGETLAFDREMRSITLTVLTRTLLSSDVGSEAIDEIERLLRV